MATKQPPATDDVQTSAPATAEHDRMIDTLTTDEHAGKGGSYVYDPVTGTRTRQPDPEPAPE